MQLNRTTDSQYLIPAVKASESIWIAWFDKVISFMTSIQDPPAADYPPRPSEPSDDDHRTFG
jgi:hypothetical protein